MDMHGISLDRYTTGNTGCSEEGNWVTVEQRVEGGCFTSQLFRLLIF